MTDSNPHSLSIVPSTPSRTIVMQQYDDELRQQDVEEFTRAFSVYAERPLPDVLALVITDRTTSAELLRRIEMSLRLSHLPSQYHRLANVFRDACNAYRHKRGMGA